LRDTLVQQPKVTTTLSLLISWRAFSANSGQLDAGSTTTGSSFFPNTPPLALISSIAIRTVSLSTVSEIAIVPDNECSTPTLMVSCANTGNDIAPDSATAALNVLSAKRRFIVASPG
jgi:hypothetical protein